MSLFHDNIFDDPATKRCRKCGKRKSFEDFPKNKKSRDGRGSWCKDCAYEQHRAPVPITEFPASKTCTRCHETKPIDRFTTRCSSRDGRVDFCKDCGNRSTSRYHRDLKNREKIRDRHRVDHMDKKYGLTPEDYDRILASQGGVCAICREPSSRHKKQHHLHIDHDHATGKVRGILCWKCNVSLGHFGDSVEILASAIRYLEKHR